MTYQEAIEIRTAQLNGRLRDPVVVQRAIEVIAGHKKPADPRPVKNFGLTTLERRRIDKQQVRMLEDELRGRP
jgi:hypothetical protein